MHGARQIAVRLLTTPPLPNTTPFPSPRSLLWRIGGGEAARAASTRGVGLGGGNRASGVTVRMFVPLPWGRAVNGEFRLCSITLCYVSDA